MKLFDAEELKKAFVNKGQRSHRYHVGDVWELNFKEICDVLDEAPTVEAIPIEWIETYVKNKFCFAEWYGGFIGGINMMLDDWEKENGEQ